jgi:hypothetical protein
VRTLDVEAVKAWPVKKQRDGLWVLYAHHVQMELCLVGILHKVDKNGGQVTRQELLGDLARTIEAERVFINLLGRREAAKVYGAHEGVTSSMATVDFILTHDIVADYRNQPEEK